MNETLVDFSLEKKNEKNEKIKSKIKKGCYPYCAWDLFTWHSIRETDWTQKKKKNGKKDIKENENEFTEK